MAAPEMKNFGDTVIQELGGIISAPLNIEGRTVGITAGSRGLNSYEQIIKAIVDTVKKAGGTPVIIPSMGSHGQACMSGRKEVLNSLGLNQDSVGAGFIDSEDYISLGRTSGGIPVFVNKAAANVDYLIIVNRVKEHTDFCGKIESGIQKMMAIGLGSHKGCSIAHAFGVQLGLESVIRDIAELIMEKLPILCAVAILETYQGKTAEVKVIAPNDIQAEEPLLLKRAKSYSIKLPFDDLDVLVVCEIGKNISGTGMDTKVIGRMNVLGQTNPDKPRIKRIVALNLTPQSHGNALGIGLADYTTQRTFKSINLLSTSINAVASMCPEQAAIPCILKSDKAAIQAAIDTCGVLQRKKIRLAVIQNTLKLDQMFVTEALLDEVHYNRRLSIESKARPIPFDSKGRAQVQRLFS